MYICQCKCKHSISDCLYSLSHSNASEKKQVEESPSCSEAKYQSSSELNFHAASDLKCQSTSDVKYQSTSDVEYHSPSDSQYQCTTDTKYQSVYVMSDQKDECIIATEVRTHNIYPLDTSDPPSARIKHTKPWLFSFLLQVWYQSRPDQIGPVSSGGWRSTHSNPEQ